MASEPLIMTCCFDLHPRWLGTAEDIRAAEATRELASVLL
jgi:hypothetical protein